MPTFAVTYRYQGDAAERDRHRPAHRAFLGELKNSGALLASGPYVGGEPEALLVFTGESADAVLTMLDADPFMAAGLIGSRDVRQWDVVIGSVG